MDFSKISLPDFLLADLYKEGLVVIDNEINKPAKTNITPAATPPPEPAAPVFEERKFTAPPPGKSLAYLGSNKKNIAIVVEDTEALHLQDELLEFLSNILGACKLNLADVAIVNKSHQPVDSNRLKAELSPAVVLLFGIETSAIELPFSIPDYKVQQFNNCAYLQAPSLGKFRGTGNDAKLEKSKLWVCLKNLFGL